MSCNNSCNNCSCDKTENSYEDFEDIPEYQELVRYKDYSIGEYFKIGKEIFKVTADISDSCKNCEFDSGVLAEYCEKLLCSEYGRSDRNNVCVILYDTLED